MYRDLNLSKSDSSSQWIYQEPTISKSPSFYQSSLFGVKHSDDVIKLDETISFQLEVELVPDTLRKFTKFDELYSFIGREFFIWADFYTKKYNFEENSSDESELENLREFDISKLK